MTRLKAEVKILEVRDVDNEELFLKNQVEMQVDDLEFLQFS